MSLFQLVYMSQPFGFDDAMLNGILLAARRNNVRDNITGALICRADLYLQLLEGPKGAVEGAYARIKRDDRHYDVKQLVAHGIEARLFPNWAMRDDPARSWMWSQAAVANGAVSSATKAEILGVFGRVAAEPDRP
jgi:Sensors of blue-light using FAD